MKNIIITILAMIIIFQNLDSIKVEFIKGVKGLPCLISSTCGN